MADDSDDKSITDSETDGEISQRLADGLQDGLRIPGGKFYRYPSSIIQVFWDGNGRDDAEEDDRPENVVGQVVPTESLLILVQHEQVFPRL